MDVYFFRENGDGIGGELFLVKDALHCHAYRSFWSANSSYHIFLQPDSHVLCNIGVCRLEFGAGRISLGQVGGSVLFNMSDPEQGRAYGVLTMSTKWLENKVEWMFDNDLCELKK